MSCHPLFLRPVFIMNNRNTKSTFLFSPKNIFTKRPVLQIRQLIKTPTGITTGELPVTRGHIKNCFPSLSDECVKILLSLSKEELEKTEGALYQQLLYIKEAEAHKAMLQKSFTKHVQTQFTLLRQQAAKLELYYAVAGGAAVQIVKCNFYNYPAELAFTVLENDNCFLLQTMVATGNRHMPLQQFTRFNFLLEQEHTFYQLSAKSYETANWLQQQTLQYSHAETDALKTVIAQLKDKGFKTDDSILSSGEQLIVIPQHQIMLSELNNTFLKLEPRFVYEGFVVDGPFENETTMQQNGQRVTIARHKEKEQELVQFVRSLHPKFASQNNGFFYLNFDEAQKKGWFLSVYHRMLEMEIDMPGIDLMKHFRFAQVKADTQFKQLPTEGNWQVYTLSVKFGKEKLPLQYLQKSLLNGQKAVMLKDGSLGVLGDEWLQQYGMLLRHGKIRNEELLVPKWILMSEEMDATPATQSITTSSINQTWFSKWKQWEKQDADLYPLPQGLQIKALRPYQQKGYEWMRLLSEIGGNGCLADDMGLGKTLQTIAFLLHKIEADADAKHLVVAPASLLYNWQEEFKKFAPQVNTLVFHGAGRQDEDINKPEHQIIITSYGTLRQDIVLLQKTTWNTAVIDESHNIKNPAALITKAVWQLTAQTRMALSGTPVMNGTEDLFSQMHFLLPGLLGSSEFFKREYALPIKLKNDAEKAAALQKLIKPFVLRRTKEQAAPDLPEKTESVIWCEMDTGQRMAYESIKENVRSSILLDIDKNGLNKGKLSVLAGLTKLRQVCNSCELVKDEDIFDSSSVKTKVLIDELKTIIPQHRALVFSQFTSMLDLLERDLEKENIKTIRLDGQTHVSKRQDLVAAFQSEESEAAVFLISLKAGNAGLTLTRADYVFLFDPWWNTAVENQAIDRTHRIGQQQPVFAYRMICKDSIEEKIIRMSAGKKKIAEDLITPEDGFVKSLSLDDIKYLLE